jgi:hypothetical protein
LRRRCPNMSVLETILCIVKHRHAPQQNEAKYSSTLGT